MALYKKILPETKVMPVPFSPSGSTTGQLMKRVEGAQCYIFDIPDDAEGWYRVKVKAASGSGNYSGAEGYAEKVIYLWAGSRVVIWGAAGRATGYPNQTAKFGGYGGSKGIWIRKVS